MALLAIPFGLAIGLSVGMVGGGGAVLAVPVLVYVLDQGAHEATTTSLVVVAAASLAGGLAQLRAGQVCWPQVRTFAPAAVVGTVAGTLLNDVVDAGTLLVAFAGLMLVAAGVTGRGVGEAGAAHDPTCPPLRAPRTLIAGLVIGVLTGFFGVGGGFLVVPLLALAMRFPMRSAIGTSLVIVSFVSIIAFGFHLTAGSSVDVGVTVALAGAGMAGAAGGAMLSGRVPQRRLGQGFAGLLCLVAGYLLVASAFFGGPPGA